MHRTYEILELFSTPVYTSILPDNLSSLVPWLYTQEMLEDKIVAPTYGCRSKNSHILNESQCSEVNSYILNLTKEFGSQLGFKYREYKFTQSWISLKHPGQQHTAHSHPNSLISGVLFFGSPADNLPSIKFHKYIGSVNTPYIEPHTVADKRQLKYAQTEFSIDFTPGLIVLFPSYLIHSVPVNNSKVTRYSLAFNIVPQVGFGSEERLTELIF